METGTQIIDFIQSRQDSQHFKELHWEGSFAEYLVLGRGAFSTYPLQIKGELSPVSRYMYRELMKKYEGDFSKVVQHVRVKRILLSEKDRVGIGTFQPKDEKNQDSTELTGDINYRKIAEYGSDSDPRAFNFDGEFCIANRGLIEFIEILKLDVAFLYDLLGASQEHKIKPKKFAQTDIENVKAYTQKEKVRNRFTGQYEEPNERLMRSIEEKIDIPASRKDDFRREVMNYVAALALEGRIFDYKSNERLNKALELKLFEDQKDSIKLTSLVSNVVDKETQAKIDVVKERLIRQYGYNDESATDVLNFVASIFARGDAK